MASRLPSGLNATEFTPDPSGSVTAAVTAWRATFHDEEEADRSAKVQVGEREIRRLAEPRGGLLLPTLQETPLGRL